MNNQAFARYLELFSGQSLDDLPVYLGFAQRTGGPAIELGCGTGRIALALAHQGYEVTGIDNSAAMLAMARDKLCQAGLDQYVNLVQADLRDFTLEPPGKQVYHLAICAQNTFCYMLSTAHQLGMLRAVYRHLAPNGLLVIDVFNPDPVILADNDRRLTLMDVTTDPLTGHVLTQSLAREVDTGEQIEHVTMFVDETAEGRLTSRDVFEFDLRYVYRFELELLLDKAGLVLEAMYGSYDLEPFTGESERLLAVAKRAGN